MIYIPNIKPVLDLKNYNEVLRNIAVDEPIFLAKNGRGCYVIMDMKEYEKTQATVELLSELAKGERTGREQGWIGLEEIKKELEV